MKYTSLIRRAERTLLSTGRLKTARDLAALLDHPLFEIGTMETWDLEDVREVKEKAFHTLCAALHCAGADVPALPPEFYLQMGRDSDREKNEATVAALKERAERALKAYACSGKAARNVRSLLSVLEMFPSIVGYGSINMDMLGRKLNELLILAGTEPLRPDYGKYEIKTAAGRKAPQKETRVVIIDDDLKEIAKTMFALAGWKNVAVEVFHYRRGGYSRLSGNGLERRLALVADSLLVMRPNVVLIDQGLIDFDGSDLIPVVRDHSDTPPLFVANTGGSDEELVRRGAYPNCKKGENLSGVESALKRF